MLNFIVLDILKRTYHLAYKVYRTGGA